METKWLILMLVVLICLALIFIGGTIGKDMLSNDGDYEEIESLEEVKDFLEDCNKKPFLDCEQILIGRIKD